MVPDLTRQFQIAENVDGLFGKRKQELFISPNRWFRLSVGLTWSTSARTLPLPQMPLRFHFMHSTLIATDFIYKVLNDNKQCLKTNNALASIFRINMTLLHIHFLTVKSDSNSEQFLALRGNTLAILQYHSFLSCFHLLALFGFICLTCHVVLLALMAHAISLMQ